MKIRLTQSYVNSIKTPDKPYWITDAGCQNLRLYVGKARKVWYVGYRNNSNIYKNHKLGTTRELLTVALAREAADDFIYKLKKGESPQKKKASKKLTLRTFMDDIYAPERLISNPKAGQLTLNMIRSVFADRFYDKFIDELDIKDFNSWRNDRISSGVKRVTINKNVIAIRAALNWGITNGYFEQNPVQNMKLLKETDAETKVRYLSNEERIRLFSALDDREKRIREGRKNHNEWLAERDLPTRPEIGDMFADHVKPMVIVSLYSGIRKGTLLSLLWEDIDFFTGILTLRGEIMKSGDLVRVPVNSIVANTFSAWKKQSAKTSQGDLIFPSPVTGKTLKDVKKAWHTVLKEAKIENFRWHDMRHDFASQLVMKGVDLNTVRELMGHKNITTTQIYAHLAPEHKLKAVELLAETAGYDVIGNGAFAVQASPPDEKRVKMRKR